MKDKGRLGIAIFGGNPGESDEDDQPTAADMACKSMWKAIKSDDYEGFKMGLREYLDYRDKEPDKSADESGGTADDSM